MQALLQALPKIGASIITSTPKIDASIVTGTPKDWCKHYYMHPRSLVQALLQALPKIGESIMTCIIAGLKTFEKMQAKTRNTPLEFNSELVFESRTHKLANLHITTRIWGTVSYCRIFDDPYYYVRF